MCGGVEDSPLRNVTSMTVSGALCQTCTAFTSLSAYDMPQLCVADSPQLQMMPEEFIMCASMCGH